jgi:hypothetical protein
MLGNNDQLELFEIKPVEIKDKSIDAAFEAFDAANPHVGENLVRLARRLKKAGRTRIGIGHLFEVLRWEYAIQTEHRESQYTLNNNYRSRYARKIIDEYPELQDMFEIRELKSKQGKRRILVTVN